VPCRAAVDAAASRSLAGSSGAPAQPPAVAATLDGMDEPIDDATFEDWVIETIDGLPATFRERLGSVAIRIEDRPSPETLHEMGVPGLYGLYQGVPRSTLNADHAMTPSVITIYKEPCLRASRSREGVRDRVHDTVRHEIAHHFGISDARLRELAAGHSH
jgi:predicted Zn-dependent protease with MMP-like domain